MILFDLGFNVVVGASVAWASGRLLTQDTFLRSATLWALVAFEVMVVVPIAVFLSWRFPEWRLMHLLEVGDLPVSLLALAWIGPIAALLSFASVRRLLLARRRLPAAAIAAVGVLGTAGLVFYSLQFPELAEANVRERGRGLTFLVSAALLVLCFAWAMMLWRLSLLRLGGTGKARAAVLPAPVRDGRTKPLEAKKKSAGKK